MNSIEVSIRDTKTKGEVNALRSQGNVPAIIYGGAENNQKITIPKSLKWLQNETNEILMDDITIEKARNSVERMVKIGR